jgi:GDP-L-fucose synthase
MEKNSKIYVAGHTGLVGSALVRKLKEKGFSNFVFRTIDELDLGNQEKAAEFFRQEKPEYVFLAAAKVGGIVANNTYRAQFIFENIQIQNNVIHQSYLNGVKKLIFLGSSCIYPKNAEQPLKEDCLLTDELEYTNEPYSIAKIAGIKMCESYNIQYGTNFISVMPTNLYGPNDNYDLEKSHVIPAMIRKMHLGKCLMNNDWEEIKADLNKRLVEGINGNAEKGEILSALKKYGIENNSINLWGTGKPKREFLHSDDMADACVFIVEEINFKDLSKDKKEIRNTHINIGCGKDITIRELAALVKKITGYEGKLKWDSSKPDGTRQKLLNVSKLKKLGWKSTIKLEDGIASVYRQYQS